jgi:ribose transport system ATP-binding protein
MNSAEYARITSETAEKSEMPLLEMKNITKIFPGVVALDSIDLCINKGEAHVLLGENGAGKSTMIKVITGVEKYDVGEMLWDGTPVRINSVKDALELGIAVIFQELSSIPCLSVAENMFLGRQIRYKNIKGSINWKEQRKQTKEALKIVGIDIDPNTLVEKLGMGQRQLLEIAKAVSQNAKLIIFDEPTSSLSRKEIDHLLEIMLNLKEKGVSMLFITHKLDEAKKIGDVVTVLKDGKKAGFRKMEDVTEDEIVKMMVGRELSEKYPKRTNKTFGDIVLKVENLESYGLFKNVSFEVREGELLGIFGLVGAGRTEVAKAIMGDIPLDNGNVYIDGQKVKIKSPEDAINKGIVLLSENRKEEGLVLMHDVIENSTLQTLKSYRNKLGLINQRLRKEKAIEKVKEVNLRPMHPKRLAMNFSGGNQQKIVIAKCLLSNAKVFIFDEPTRGIDVGAKIEIYNIINTLLGKGKAVIMISSEMQEIMGMSDRIVTMYEGRVTGQLDNSKTLTQEEIMISTTGGNLL